MSDSINILSELQGISDAPEYEARLIKEKKLSDKELALLLERRKKGEPLSKILGEKGFFKDIFKTSTDVLDPRADSETLVETVLRYVPDNGQHTTILDIGTGSGCLLISLAKEYKNVVAIGVDKSAAALQVAAQNAKDLAPQKDIYFLERDFTLPEWTLGFPPCNIIISNPPYIKTADIEKLDIGVRSYDPLLALDGGADGLDCYRALSKSLFAVCTEETKIFFEIGKGQSQEVVSLMRRHGFSLLEKVKDLNGIIRVLVFTKE